MKKLLVLVAAGVVAGVLVAPVRADIVDLLTFQSAVNAAQAVDPTLAAPTNDGNHDFTVGGFDEQFGGHVGFSAQSGPRGQGPQGHLSSTDDATGLKERYDVVCVAVSGQDAALGLEPTSSPKDNSGTPRILIVHDGRLPGGGGDRYAFSLADPTKCAAFVHGGAVVVPVTGNILVHDEL
jgi:hypothetical protein